jgi:dsRNA-specific ribonuclease
MGNVIEGLMGAMLEDSGYDIEVCRDIYTKHILPHFDKYCLGPHEESQNPKDRLHKLMSMRKCQHFAIRKDDLNVKSGEYEATSMSP